MILLATSIGSGEFVLWITVAALVAIGISLTASPVVYQLVEKAQMVMVGLILLFLVLAVTLGVEGRAYTDLVKGFSNVGQFTSEIPIATLLGALAFAGAGGTVNLVQSNWIRDKGLGMGAYSPRLSPLTIWAEIVFGSIVLLVVGITAPLVLLVISSATNGVAMFVSSVLLLRLNRFNLPSTIRVRGCRLAAMAWSVPFFGFFSATLVWDEGGKLFGGRPANQPAPVTTWSSSGRKILLALTIWAFLLLVGLIWFPAVIAVPRVVKGSRADARARGGGPDQLRVRAGPPQAVQANRLAGRRRQQPREHRRTQLPHGDHRLAARPPGGRRPLQDGHALPVPRQPGKPHRRRSPDRQELRRHRGESPGHRRPGGRPAGRGRPGGTGPGRRVRGPGVAGGAAGQGRRQAGVPDPGPRVPGPGT